ncbi:MAG TPA: hypothetical protein VKV77_01325 [Methylovirgula sp.]|nr:hypothetical protein [Methylovirgula sp.]
MEKSPKPPHRFNIWSLVELDANSPGAPPAAPPALPARPLADLQHRTMQSIETRATTRPFKAKCVMPSNVNLSCTTTKVQPDWIDFAYGNRDPGFEALGIETRIGFELDFFGTVHGALRRKSEKGFSISPEIVYHEILLKKLLELHAEAIRFEEEKSNLDRLTARVTLRDPECIYQLIDGDRTLHRAKVVMLSHEIATLRTARIQRAGTRLLLGSNPGRTATVLRSFETGFTVKFDTMIEALSEDLKFC